MTAFCGCKTHVERWHRDRKLIQYYLCFMSVSRNEDNVICIFQINEVLVSNQMHTWILKIRECTFHHFIYDEVKQERREWATLSNTTFRWKHFEQFSISSHPPINLRIHSLDDIDKLDENVLLHKNIEQVLSVNGVVLWLIRTM